MKKFSGLILANFATDFQIIVKWHIHTVWNFRSLYHLNTKFDTCLYVHACVHVCVHAYMFGRINNLKGQNTKMDSAHKNIIMHDYNFTL